jgi:hypothetical protein
LGLGLIVLPDRVDDRPAGILRFEHCWQGGTLIGIDELRFSLRAESQDIGADATVGDVNRLAGARNRHTVI